MLRERLDTWSCHRCRYYKEDLIPKRKCKTCSTAYTSEFKKKSEFTRRGKMKERREASDKNLATLYQRIKEKYFDGRYLPESRLVLFTWKNRRGRFGAWCHKGRKEIRVGSEYRDCFVHKTDGQHFNWQKGLVMLMIHEALHLRLPHHRKSFRIAEVEYKGKVQEQDIAGLYEGLMRNGTNESADEGVSKDNGV